MTLTSGQFNEIIKYPFSGKIGCPHLLTRRLIKLPCPFSGNTIIGWFVITHTDAGLMDCWIIPAGMISSIGQGDGDLLQ